MGTAELMLAGGFVGGTVVTAALLWFHERRTRRVLEDVSGRLRRAEARTHTLLRESHDVLAVVAADATITYLSPGAERVLGASATAYVGAPLPSLVHPDDRGRVAPAVRRGSPAASSQPRVRSSASCSEVSTPSATARSPTACGDVGWRGRAHERRRP